MTDFVIITGLSGAGRSHAGATLEDLGWYVMDNIPTALITQVADQSVLPDDKRDRLALVVGRDAGQLEALNTAVGELRSRGHAVRVVYLDASDEVLVRRFEGTRRRHPIGREKVVEAIALERERLAPIRLAADVIIDTSELNIHQLRQRLAELFVYASGSQMQITTVSFGFKWGLPLDVDNVFDARFLPNPHWVPELKELTGLDADVRDYVLGQPAAGDFLGRVEHLLELVLPACLAEGRAYLSVAVGCTGGRHRSVVLAEEMAKRIRSRGYRAATFHRDIHR